MTQQEAQNKRVQELALVLLFEFGVNTFPKMRNENPVFDEWWRGNYDEQHDPKYQLLNWYQAAERTQNEKDFALRWAFIAYGDDAVELARHPERGGFL